MDRSAEGEAGGAVRQKWTGGVGAHTWANEPATSALRSLKIPGFCKKLPEGGRSWMT
jgi:hypothetical protein